MLYMYVWDGWMDGWIAVCLSTMYHCKLLFSIERWDDGPVQLLFPSIERIVLLEFIHRLVSQKIEE